MPLQQRTMDPHAQEKLVNLIRNQRTAALGTLQPLAESTYGLVESLRPDGRAGNGAPEVSLVLFAASEDCRAFYIHISRLAHHTQNILRDARVSLMLAEPDDGSRNAQTLARVSLQGEAILLQEGVAEYAKAQSAYLSKFPESEMNFSLGDFGLYTIEPRTARFVAGFGQIYNLTLSDFKEAGAVS